VTRHPLTLLLLAGFVATLAWLGVRLWGYPLPGNQEGYEPPQPIAFSHRLHAGALEINCLYCHYSAGRSPHAGIPPSSLCMNCHKQVTASTAVMQAEQDLARQEGRPPKRIISDGLRPLYKAMGLKDDLEPEAGKEPVPIRWVKVHNVPDYTRFDHRVHVNAKVKCQECHGPVETMEVIRQSADLSMGWCLRCHKEARESDGRKLTPSIDCAACHY
jgi:hypothetical protein